MKRQFGPSYAWKLATEMFAYWKIVLARMAASCFDGNVIPVLERLKSVQKKFEKVLTLDRGFVILRSHTE
ncbi:MAG: hypothetical protein L0Y58_25255 [Verrucomicrobia subdivision 3 bacterium]|nr:hypothetical protein [Limisphaerales bacterium]